jgi:hypothetical protein
MKKYGATHYFKIIVILAIIVIRTQSSYAQNLGVKISQNSTAYPITGAIGMFKAPLHPGLQLAYEIKLNKNEKSQLLNESNLGFFYHRFFQTAVFLNDVIKFNYAFKPQFSAFAGVGAGYLHSIYQYSIFKINDSGSYEEINKLRGRSQFMGVFSLGVSYGFKHDNPDAIRATIEFGSFVHGTFAKSYVPLVPYNCLQVGLHLKLKSK